METQQTIKIAKHLDKYSPGDGARAGEKFYRELLHDEFKKALDEKRKLLINLSGLREWPSSFVEASFGKLAREFGIKTVLNSLQFESKDNPMRKEKAKYVIRNSGRKQSVNP